MPATHTMYTQEGKAVSVDISQIELLKKRGYTMKPGEKVIDPVAKAQEAIDEAQAVFDKAVESYNAIDDKNSKESKEAHDIASKAKSDLDKAIEALPTE